MGQKVLLRSILNILATGNCCNGGVLMKREKYYEREALTTEEKETIAKKSDNRCCHCGKMCFIGYQGTIDHFVPLHRGGSGRDINLIMLCKDCNKAKDSRIVDINYIPYLKEEHKKKLREYLDSYIKSFDYISRHSLFAYDDYTITLRHPTASNMLKRGRRNPKGCMGITCHVKLATYGDFGRLCDYFEKYLKKYNSFSNRKLVEANISFWLKFGCIYYIEKNGEIAVMTVMTIKHVDAGRRYRNIPYTLNMYIFSYYSSEIYGSLVYNIVDKFPGYIMDEQSLNFINIDVYMVSSDSLCARTCYAFTGHGTKRRVIEDGVGDQFSGFSYILSRGEEKEDGDARDKLVKFFEGFGDMADEIKRIVLDTEYGIWVAWMAYDIISLEDAKEMGLPSPSECIDWYEQEEFSDGVVCDE